MIMNRLMKPSLWRRSGLALATAVIIFVTAACSGGTTTGSSSDSYPMTIDNCGREITIQEQPKNLYVIGGEAGTIVHAAGGADVVHTFSPLPNEPLGEATGPLGEANQAPIRTASEMSREMIVGADPDLLVTFGLSGFDPEDLEAVGIPTIVISGYCGGFGAGQSMIEDPIEGILEDIQLLGKVLGTEEQAQASITDIRTRIDAVKERVEQSAPAGLLTAPLYVNGPDSGIGGYGRRSMLHQQMEYLGLTNIFEGANERYFEPSIESFIDAAPDRIIALYMPGSTTEDEVQSILLERPDLSQVPAIVNENILAIDFFYSGHGTLAIDGLERIADLIVGVE
ncbi:ABC transporter substrate-binding protein [Bacillus horti]|uniref:Iron complex transport system substrate-binding protein n=1 Tax=Caldalkalibacillus horti TaxID=77523 RepID=A0ABT9VYP3_9BACI|nr:ABC transporter substrate-binding protein [Bacillus horti]MDQ0166116.1 iron complex transport system substrate-binding protein [Bacillus horti]